MYFNYLPWTQNLNKKAIYRQRKIWQNLSLKGEVSLMPIPVDPRMNAFYLLTGVTFVSFASGFGVCLFNMDTIDACVQVADSWVDIFHAAGNHVIAWWFAIVNHVFHG
jgi:hypothetical protein